jgi:hypothetical protein
MPNEITVSLIAFIGVIVSTLISSLVSVRQTKNEIRKMRTEIHKEFGSKLFEKRLQVYPELYALLSGFVKTIQFGKVSSSMIKDFISKWQEWDTKNAIFFSGATGHISYELHKMFVEIANKSEEELQKDLSAPETLSRLRKQLGTLELALKHELGVFGFETPSSFEASELLDEYAKAARSIVNKNVR